MMEMRVGRHQRQIWARYARGCIETYLQVKIKHAPFYQFHTMH